MFKKILLPIDMNHPESWEKALPAALHCAGPEGTIHLLAVVHDLGSAMIASYLPAGFEKQAMQQLKIELLDFANTHLPEGTDFEIHVGHGHVAETILRVADKHKVDLIVMASHPPNELQTFLVGSQAGKVVRNAAVPVMVVR